MSRLCILSEPARFLRFTEDTVSLDTLVNFLHNTDVVVAADSVSVALVFGDEDIIQLADEDHIVVIAEEAEVYTEDGFNEAFCVV